MIGLVKTADMILYQRARMLVQTVIVHGRSRIYERVFKE